MKAKEIVTNADVGIVENNVALDAINAILAEASRIGGAFGTPWEGYAKLKKELECVSSLCGSADKLLKELWEALKTSNEDAVVAYTSELGAVARNAAQAYITISAMTRKF